MLKPLYRSLMESHKEQEIQRKREVMLLGRVLAAWPEEIEGEYSVDSLGASFVRCFMHLDKAAPAETTGKVVAAMVRHFGPMTRDFRGDSGTFMWKLKEYSECEDVDGKYSMAIFIENAHPGECKIETEEVTVTRYKAICPGGVNAAP